MFATERSRRARYARSRRAAAKSRPDSVLGGATACRPTLRNDKPAVRPRRKLPRTEDIGLIDVEVHRVPDPVGEDTVDLDEERRRISAGKER